MEKWRIFALLCLLVVSISGCAKNNTGLSEQPFALQADASASVHEEEVQEQAAVEVAPPPNKTAATELKKPKQPTPVLEDPDIPSLKLKSVGVNLDYYDTKTGMAGDLKFTKAEFMFGIIFSDYGYYIPGEMSASGKGKFNPQPTFTAPMGTKVLSLVDGVVTKVPILYSGDYSVHVASNPQSRWIYETEHVINPLVKVGDPVMAGQVIAEVSPHNNDANSGFGIVEIGILKGGNPPQHVCPFAYLDESIRDDVQKKLTALYKSWEDYRGDSSLYDESALKMPGCLTLDPIDG